MVNDSLLLKMMFWDRNTTHKIIITKKLNDIFLYAISTFFVKINLESEVSQGVE